MKSAVVKHSIFLLSRKTSVSLEQEFWAGLKEIAKLQGTTAQHLIDKIARDRDNSNLSSAVRQFVLKFYRDRAKGPELSSNATGSPAS